MQSLASHRADPISHEYAEPWQSFESGAVEHLTNRTYVVRSQSDTSQTYTVKPDHDIGCDCPDAKNGWECKHQFAVKLHELEEAENAYCAEKEAEQAEYEGDRFCAECNDLYDFPY